MDKIFEQAFKKTLKVEGGYVDHPDDPGGATKYGITQRRAEHLGYEGDIKDLTLDQAKEIYFQHYWLSQQYNRIKNRFIAIEMFDQAVNMGSRKANKNLQKAYNLLVDDLITVDGVIGPETLRAVNDCSKPTALFNILNGYQIMHYINLAESDDRYKSFIAGWANKRIEIIRK